MDSRIPAPVTEAATAVKPGARQGVVLALVGSGGDGVALLGDLLLRMAAQQGLYGMMVQSYGPQIRGGESAVILRLGTEEVLYEGEEADLLLCFRMRDLARFRGAIRLHADGQLVYDAAEQAGPPEWLGPTSRPTLRHPFATIENGEEVPGVPKNMVALGLLCRSLGWAPDLARHALEQRFAHRPAVLAADLAGFETGFAASETPALPALKGHGVPLVVESGNEASARGAMDAGLRFFAGYPITPSSEIMETLIEELPGRGGRVVQAEDEMAALGMVIGASCGGVPAMTATSGPGLSLMTEMIGLSSMAEIPVVVVDCQRAGPATGMPSRTEQSDLNHALFGGHGDFPRVVMGAFDVVHARDVMHRAFHLAESYQLPVLVLSDAYIAQRRQIRDPIVETRELPRRVRWSEADGGDPRFAVAQAVTPFRVPGTKGGYYLAAGIEHNEEGNPTADGGVHERMNAKRFRKLEAIAAETRDWYRTLGRDDAPHGIIAWGSQYGMLREWVAGHPDHRVFLPEILHPFPLEALAAWRRGLSSLAVVELSFQGQLHQALSGITDMAGVRKVTRSGGLPLTPGELTRRLEEARS